MTHKQITPVTPISSFHPDNERRAPKEYPSDYAAKIVVGLLDRGFKEGTLPDNKIRDLEIQLTEIGRALGQHLVVDHDEGMPVQARNVLGMLWLQQVLSMSIGAHLSEDPVVALALSEVWSSTHVAGSLGDFDDAQRERFNTMIDGQAEHALELLDNLNRNGCPCGKDHTQPQSTEVTDENRAAIKLASKFGIDLVAATLEGLDEATRAKLSLISSLTGKSERELVEQVVAGNKVMPPILEPEPVDGAFLANMSQQDFDADPVGRLVEIAAESIGKGQGKPLTPNQLAALRTQLESQRESITSDAGVVGLHLKLPRA